MAFVTGASWEYFEGNGWREMAKEFSDVIEEHFQSNCEAFSIMLPDEPNQCCYPCRRVVDLANMEQRREWLNDERWEVIATKKIRRVFVCKSS